MHAHPIAARPNDDLIVTAVRMVREGIRHVPVIDPDQHVIGILSDRDLRVMMGDPARSVNENSDSGEEDVTVDWAMTADPITIAVDAPAAELVPLLVDQRLGAVPVIDGDKRLCGIVSYVDLLRYLLARTPL